MERFVEESKYQIFQTHFYAILGLNYDTEPNFFNIQLTSIVSSKTHKLPKLCEANQINAEEQLDKRKFVLFLGH